MSLEKGHEDREVLLKLFVCVKIDLGIEKATEKICFTLSVSGCLWRRRGLIRVRGGSKEEGRKGMHDVPKRSPRSNEHY